MQGRTASHAILGVSSSELHALKVAGRKRRGALIADVATECGLTRNAAVRLRRLRAEGFLRSPGWRLNGQVKFILTDKGRQALASVARTEPGE